MPKEVKEVVVDEVKKDEKPVEVALDENNNPVKSEAQVKEEPKYVRLEDMERVSKALENSRQYSQRKIGSLEEKIDKFIQTFNAPRPQNQPNVPQDEWEGKLQKDWKGTVEELAEQKARDLYKKLRDEEREQTRLMAEEARNQKLREDNKRTVLERHRELQDENSTKAQVFRRVIEEHPEYLPNPFGPVLAMRDMEDKLRELGVVDEPTRKVVDKELQRQTRASAGTIPSGSSPGASNKVVLSKDEKDFCDQNGIKYETYASNKRKTSSNQGVEA